MGNGITSQRNRARVLIVILNWNGAENTLEALKHASAQEHALFEIMVIDNGSTDGSLDRLRRIDRPPFRLLALPKNIGFARGMNMGLREASRNGFDYVWLLNNDAFPQPQCLPTLVRFMEQHPAVMITTPRLLSPNGAEQHAGGRILWEHCDVSCLLSAELRGPAVRGTWLTGTAMLIRPSVYDKVGGFDPQFFAYFEDTDLSLRVFRHGGDLRAVPEAVCYHLGGASSGGTDTPFSSYIATRNTWLLLRKHVHPAKRLATVLRHRGIYLEWAAKFATSGQEAHAVAALGGLWAASRGRFGRPGTLKGPHWLNGLVLCYPQSAQRIGRFIRSAGDFVDQRGGPHLSLDGEPV